MSYQAVEASKRHVAHIEINDNLIQREMKWLNDGGETFASALLCRLWNERKTPCVPAPHQSGRHSADALVADARCKMP